MEVLHVLSTICFNFDIDIDVYLRVGDSTSKTKDDPIVFHLYSNREDMQRVMSKLVAGIIIHLREASVSSRHGTSLFVNDKCGYVDIIHFPDALASDHAKYCRHLLESTIPLCVLHRGFFPSDSSW